MDRQRARTFTHEDLRDPKVYVQLGLPPNRIDIMSGIKAVGFEEAWGERVQFHYADQPASIIGRSALIREKRATGRPQDLIDAEALSRSPEE